MTLTSRQLTRAIRMRQKRIKELLNDVGYPENHPLVQFNLRHLVALQKERERRQGVAAYRSSTHARRGSERG